MKNIKVGWPVIALAMAALAGLLYFMGTTILAEPIAIHTKPPSWIDEKTGRPKAQTGGSGKPADAATQQPGTSGAQARPGK